MFFKNVFAINTRYTQEPDWTICYILGNMFAFQSQKALIVLQCRLARMVE